MRLPAFLLVLAALTACSRDERAAPDDGAVTAMPPADDASLRAGLAPGDVRIVETSGQFDLALIGDTISAGLAPAALETARSATDTAGLGDGGVASSLERMVKGTVQGAVAKRVAFPLSAIDDARYESGRIVFAWNGDRSRLLESTNVNGKPLLERFRPDDARRFVEAVRARKRAPPRP